MKVSLTKGLDAEGKSDVRSAFLSCLPFRKQMVKILKGKIETMRKKTCSKDFLSEQGDWALKQADSMGYERAQREFIELMQEKSI